MDPVWQGSFGDLTSMYQDLFTLVKEWSDLGQIHCVNGWHSGDIRIVTQRLRRQQINFIGHADSAIQEQLRR